MEGGLEGRNEVSVRAGLEGGFLVHEFNIMMVVVMSGRSNGEEGGGGEFHLDYYYYNCFRFVKI